MTRDRAKLRNKTAAKVHESGVTLIELLVGLVVTSLLAIAVFTFFLDTSRGISQQNAQGDMWQKGRNALAIMRQAIESAGYGLPSSFKYCTLGAVPFSHSQSGYLLAVTASAQSVGSGYNPGVSTYTLQTVIGGNTTGGIPIAQVQGVDTGGSLTVNPLSSIQPGDLAVIALGGGAQCVIGQITDANGVTLDNNCQPTGSNPVNSQSSGTITLSSNSGTGTCLPFSLDKLLLTTQSSPIFGITATAYSNANVIDIGRNNLLYQQFSIMENPKGSTPTLYMTQVSAAQPSLAPQPLASGVVDLQVRYIVKNTITGTIKNMVTPEDYYSNYTPFSNNPILAVQLAMLIRGTQYLPKSLSPSTFNILGTTYTVPTSNGPGCLQGNCRHYEYHLFQTIVPVRNGIWGQRLEG